MTHCRCRWRWASMHVLLFVSNLKSNSAGCCICLQDTMPLAPYCNFVMTLASVDVFDPESAQSFSLADIHFFGGKRQNKHTGLAGMSVSSQCWASPAPVSFWSQSAELLRRIPPDTACLRSVTLCCWCTGMHTDMQISNIASRTLALGNHSESDPHVLMIDV